MDLEGVWPKGGNYHEILLGTHVDEEAAASWMGLPLLRCTRAPPTHPKDVMGGRGKAGCADFYPPALPGLFCGAIHSSVALRALWCNGSNLRGGGGHLPPRTCTNFTCSGEGGGHAF